jgi:glycosyltransferase involved in cell wall biosynthesis
VGLDAKRIVRNGTGLGSYGRTLANDLSQVEGLNLRLYAPDEGRAELRKQVAERANLCYCYPQSPLAKPATPIFAPIASLYKSYWRSRGIVGQLRHDGVQLYHGLSGELPIGIRKAGIRTVVTIHDLIFLRHPEYYNWIDTKIYRRKFFQTLKEADRIVAISECTRRDIAVFGQIPEERIDLIYQSCATRFSQMPTAQKAEEVRLRYGLPGRYVLSVGSIEERKNALLALKSLHWLPGDIGLVLVGKTTDYTKRLTEYARQNNLSDRLFLLHGVPDDDLPAIYGRAEVFVYPSRYEGFGIPIIEAIRMGLPVVACTGSCLEEAGGPDSLYVGPDDAEGMAAAIQKLLNGTDEREGRISRSQEYVRRFENNDAAERFASLYEDILPF